MIRKIALFAVEIIVIIVGLIVKGIVSLLSIIRDAMAQAKDATPALTADIKSKAEATSKRVPTMVHGLETAVRNVIHVPFRNKEEKAA